MSTKIKETTPTAAAGAVLTPEELTEHLRTLRAQIPGYAQLTGSETLSILSAGKVDPRFVTAAINTAGASPRVEGAIGKSAAVMREESDDNTRWTAVEDELRSMLKGVAAANRLRRHRLGLSALQTYHISRQLARQPEHADLLPHIAEMKRLIRGGRKRSKPAEDPPAVPAAIPTTA
jgi:hypothetical protein